MWILNNYNVDALPTDHGETEAPIEDFQLLASRLSQGPSSATTLVEVEHAKTAPAVRAFMPPQVIGAS